MELFVYSGGSARQLMGVVESYEYLRWTRRYSRCGSFELKAIAAPENMALLKEGNILHKSDDQEAGVIERVELSQTDREIITASGRFATSFLGRRIVWGTEKLSGDLGAAVGQLLNRHILSPTETARRITGISYSAPNFGIAVSSQTSYRNLLESVSDLCDGLGIGIKTVFNPASGLFTVTLYNGGNSSAVFSKEYENLTEQTYIESVDDYANTALIGGEGEGSARQFVTIAQGSGEHRREVFVDARDLQSADFPGNYTETLTFRGQSRLAELAPRYSFDAGVNPHGNLRYKTDFDLGNVVKVIAKPWGVSMTARITEIEETYDAEGVSLFVTFGKSELTLAQKMRSDMSGMKTSLLAPSGGGCSRDIADASVTTAKVADGAVTLAKINSAALPSTSNTYAQRIVTDTYQNAGAVDLNTYMTAGEFTLYNVTTATNFPTGTWTGTGNTPHLIVRRYYANTSVRQILTKRNSPNDIWTRTASAAATWAAWYKIPAFGDGSEVATANLANGAVTNAKLVDGSITTAKIGDGVVSAGKIASSAVTTAKMAQEASTSISITWGSGVSLAGTQNSYVNKGVVVLGFQINVTTAVAPGNTMFTITTAAFRPYTTVRSVLIPVPTFVTNVPITIDSGGVVKNAASGTTLPTGYYMVCVTYARA